MSVQNIAIFASGGGSNAGKIMAHFQGHSQIRVVLVVSNKPDAGVIGLANDFQVPTHIIQRHSFYQTQALLETLRDHRADWIVLAGFLWLIPPYLLAAFPGKIINIHPSLLPRYGGKGMYGMHVHEAVYAAREAETGITIHTIDEEYDRGQVLFQARVALDPNDTPAEIARKVQVLEHRYFPEVIEKAIKAAL